MIEENLEKYDVILRQFFFFLNSLLIFIFFLSLDNFFVFVFYLVL